MSLCPLCGNQVTEPKAIKINDKKLESLCTTCQSYLICLTKPVSQLARTNAQIWATEMMSKNPHPYVGDILKICYDYSFSDKITPTDANVTNNVAAEEKTEADACVSQEITISTANTNVVKAMVYLSYILFLIGGAALGFILFETVGLFIGGFLGLLVAVITNSIIMMFVEISENTAINAEANLRNEILLSEICEHLKKSQK